MEEFSKEKIAKAWYIINHPSSQEETKAANDYLYAFKKADNVKEIIIDLILSQNENERTFGSIILYQYIREYLDRILESKDLYNQYKDILFTKLLPLTEASLANSTSSSSSHTLITDKIYSSTTIILLIGLITYWPDAIDHLLEYSTQSPINRYTTVVILSYCKQELNDINITQKQVYMIESRLIDKKDDIKLFINSIIQPNETMTPTVMDQKLYMKAIELTKSWVKYELNALSLPQMTKSLLMNMNTDNMDQLSELFEESIQYCTSAKIETFQDSAIEEYVNKSNENEMMSISFLISMIKQFVMNKMKTGGGAGSTGGSPNDIKSLNSLARIFSSLTENFVFLFFLKNDTSRDLLDLLYYFVSYPNRAISSKFFEGINVIKIFINTEYKFSNLSNEEKVEFSNYLIQLIKGVMSNCKLKSFPKLSHYAGNNNSSTNNSSIDNNQPSLQSENDQNDYDFKNNDISINSYRSYTEDVFLNIFTIFAQNFKDEGALFFLKNIIQILTEANISDDTIKSDPNRLLIIETVLFVVRNIIETFEALNLDFKPLIEFIVYFIKSKAINNEYMLHSFLLLLESTASYISCDKQLYQDINAFLINTAKYKPLEKIATVIMLSINDTSHVFSEKVVEMIYDFYQTQFYNLDMQSLCNVAESICAAVAILDKDRKLISMSIEEVGKYMNKILEHVNGQIDLIVKGLKKQIGENNINTGNIGNTSININDISNDLCKLYSIIIVVFKQINFIDNKDFLWEIFQYHFIQHYSNTSIIFKLFSSNTPLITQITIFYNKITSKIGTKCLSIFDQMNYLMLNSYEANNNNFNAFFVLSNLYTQAAPQSEDKLRYVSSIFFSLIHQTCLNIIKNNSQQIEATTSLASFFHNVIHCIPYAEFNDSNIAHLYNTIDFFIDAFKQIIENTMINNILKAFSAFMSSKIVPVNVIGNKYHVIVRSVFECFEHFSAMTINQLVVFSAVCLRLDSNLFLLILKSVLEGNNFRMFNGEHVKLVIEYFVFSNQQEVVIKNILTDLVNIAKGMGQVDKLKHYEIEMARAKIGKMQS